MKKTVLGILHDMQGGASAKIAFPTSRRLQIARAEYSTGNIKNKGFFSEFSLNILRPACYGLDSTHWNY